MDHSSHLSKERPDNGRTTIVRLLNKQLADTLDLRLQARQSYFNVRGSYCQELRSLFDGLARDLRHFAREIGDSATVDVVQVISVSIENDLWFLEAYLEGIVVGLHGRKLPVWTSTLSNQCRTDQSESAASSGTA